MSYIGKIVYACMCVCVCVCVCVSLCFINNRLCFADNIVCAILCYADQSICVWGSLCSATGMFSFTYLRASVVLIQVNMMYCYLCICNIDRGIYLILIQVRFGTDTGVYGALIQMCALCLGGICCVFTDVQF